MTILATLKVDFAEVLILNYLNPIQHKHFLFEWFVKVHLHTNTSILCSSNIRHQDIYLNCLRILFPIRVKASTFQTSTSNYENLSQIKVLITSLSLETKSDRHLVIVG